MDEKQQKHPGKTKPDKAATADAAAGKVAKPADRPVKKKKVVRDVSMARAYVQCTFNNTIVSITDDHGGVIAWASSGSVFCC